LDGTTENVKLLAIFHWIVAVMAGLFGLFPLIYVGFGTAILHGVFASHRQQAPPPFLGWMMIGIGLAFCLGFLAYAIALGFAASCYSQHRRWTYCLVVAVVSCAWFPFGTMLGAFSILTLARPETKALFGEGLPVPQPSGAGSEPRMPFR
jgi:hypothetical protein